MRRRGDSQMAKGAGFYWDCGRPRPQLPNTNLAKVDLTLSEVIEKEVVSRFALIAGGGAAVPVKRRVDLCCFTHFPAISARPLFLVN